MAVPDMDVIREIPGYKMILKAVLKAQIQQLVEQLATTTSEESVILMASVADGTLSHLGSELAKGFLEDNEDVKSQFLRYCLKRQHKKEQETEEKKRQEMMNSRLLPSPPQHSYMPGPRRNPKAWPDGPGPGYPGRGGIRSPGVRHEPYPQVCYPSPRASSSSAPATTVKQEPQDTSNDSFIDSEKVNQSKLCSEDDNQSNSAHSTAGGSETDNDQSDHGAEVKVGASESDLELEITGVEPGTPAVSQSWSPDNMPFDPDIGATGTAADQQTENLPGAFFQERISSDCEICGKTFISRSQMKRHMTIHTGEKPFSCDICQKSFTQKTNLKSHMTLHSGEKPWSCQKCNRSFRLKKNLKTHERVHLPKPVLDKKRFLCMICNKRFTTKQVLERHQVLHTGEKPWVCHICNKRFNVKGNMKTHMITHLTDENIEQATESPR